MSGPRDREWQATIAETWLGNLQRQAQVAAFPILGEAEREGNEETSPRSRACCGQSVASDMKDAAILEKITATWRCFAATYADDAAIVSEDAAKEVEVDGFAERCRRFRLVIEP